MTGHLTVILASSLDFFNVTYILGWFTSMNDLADAAIGAALSSDWAKASEINLEILKSDPVNLDTLNRLGRAYTELGDIDKASKTYKRVLKIDKYNQIALKNLERISGLGKRKKSPTTDEQSTLICDFIEEPGKTKIASLVNVASPKVISNLRPTTTIALKPKRHTIVVCLNDQNETYLGSLPDDLGHRLETLIRGGNTYEAYIKSSSKSSVTIFIRETGRSKKYRNIPSFVLYSFDHQVQTPTPEEEPAKKGKAAEDSEDEEEHAFQKITQLHSDEEADS